jgi:hypothetical protein
VSRHEDEPQNIPIVPNEYPKNEKLISLFYPICLNFFSADEKTTFGDKLYSIETTEELFPSCLLV